MFLRSLRTAVFCLLALSLFISVTAVYLAEQAPRQMTSGIEAALVTGGEKVLALSSHRFACTESDTLVWCTLQIEGQALDMGVKREMPGGSLKECTVTLDGRALACQATYSMRSLGPLIVIEDDLGLSDGQLGQLRRAYWLDNVSESTWIQAATVMAILFGLNVLWLLWLVGKRLYGNQKSQFAVSGLGGVVAYGGLWLVWLWVLLAQGWID